MIRREIPRPKKKSKKKPSIIKRRVIPQKDDTEWSNLVLTSLNPKSIGTNLWGCLNKNGELFRISTLSKIKVPQRIVDKLELFNKIELNTESGFYELNKTPILRRSSVKK